MLKRTWTAALLAVLMVAAALPAVAADSGTDPDTETSYELTQFTDTVGNTFENAIDWLVDQGITVGCNPPSFTRFCPGDPVTRGQMAVFLSRALSLPAPSGDYFNDDTGAFYESAANRMFEAGITVGCNPPTNNRFCGEDEVTRAQMATFLTRGFDFPATNTDYFIDDNSSVHQNSINRIREVGVTVGCNPPTGNQFCPSDTVTRGQMSAFIKRAVEWEPPCAGTQSIPDAECQALLALYDGNGGTNWTISTNWLSGNACNWFGVTCAGGHVTAIELGNNNLAGTIPGDTLTKFPSLSILDLSDNTLTGGIPAQLGSITTLTILDLSSNDTLGGTLPSQLGNLSNVIRLDLNKLALTGGIPGNFANLDSLTELSLSENSLGGAVPGFLGSLPLTDLDLELNSFTSVNSGLWTSTTLTDVDISNNSLGGTLPASYPASLTELDLSANGLTGEVSDALATLANLTSLTLANNQLVDNSLPNLQLHGADLSELTLNTNGCLQVDEATFPGLTAYIAARDAQWNNGCP